MSNGEIVTARVYIVEFRYVDRIFAADICIVASDIARAAAMAESYMAQNESLHGHTIESIKRIDCGDVLLDPFVLKD